MGDEARSGTVRCRVWLGRCLIVRKALPKQKNAFDPLKLLGRESAKPPKKIFRRKRLDALNGESAFP